MDKAESSAVTQASMGCDTSYGWSPDLVTHPDQFSSAACVCSGIGNKGGWLLRALGQKWLETVAHSSTWHITSYRWLPNLDTCWVRVLKATDMHSGVGNAGELHEAL